MADVEIHIFGIRTSVGQSLLGLLDSVDDVGDVFCYSRSQSVNQYLHSFVDFLDPSSFTPSGHPGTLKIWVVFAPIWKFSPFLEHLRIHKPECLSGLSCILACSSTSVITKRFAINNFDRKLVDKLKLAEDQLINSCNLLDISCRILRPTLI